MTAMTLSRFEGMKVQLRVPVKWWWFKRNIKKQYAVACPPRV